MTCAKTLKVGDSIQCEVRHPYPYTIRMRLLEPGAVAYANELLANKASGWCVAAGVRGTYKAQPSEGSANAISECPKFAPNGVEMDAPVRDAVEHYGLIDERSPVGQAKLAALGVPGTDGGKHG